MTIRFGTSGWRGILADDFGFDGVRAVSAAVARWASESGVRPRVVVAHDTRFLGDRFASVAARVLTAAGIRPIRPSGPVPTPVASSAVRHRRAAAGIIFTASHNPPEYQGLKVVAPCGGGATDEITDRLEAWAAEVLASGPPPEAEPRGGTVDLRGPYLDRLLGQLDRARMRRSGVRLFYDALHGTGAGFLDEALVRCGLVVEVRRGDRDPCFGGVSPDPVPERLGSLAREVRRGKGLRLGLATDGDADRFGVIDADGRPLSESAALALLVDHLARKGLSALRGTLPSQVDGARVLECDERDGLRVTLEDGFLMFRASGTEPVLRIYAEARGPRLLSRRLRIGRQLLARAAR